jgi:hypothetical protein
VAARVSTTAASLPRLLPDVGPGPGESARAPRRTTLHPGRQMLRQLLRRGSGDLLARARDRWELAPGSTVEIRSAKALPGQVERVRATEFGSVDHVMKHLAGGFAVEEGPTMAYRLEDVVLVDGVLYAGDAVRHLKPRTTRRPWGRVPDEPLRASLYESWSGNRWFGNWLMDDCLAYPVAAAQAPPLASSPPIGHQVEYESRLGMKPCRAGSARFAELVLLDDSASNEHKRARADAFRRTLMGPEPARHAGVFVLRGSSGSSRVLRNERAIAEHLAARRGFRVLDPLTVGVTEIVAACCGAEVVAGVEGSHLVHGLMLMPPGARLLVLQPPTRTVSVLKIVTDRQQQDFAYVVGTSGDEEFHIDVDDVERTLDLG